MGEAVHIVYLLKLRWREVKARLSLPVFGGLKARLIHSSTKKEKKEKKALAWH